MTHASDVAIVIHVEEAFGYILYIIQLTLDCKRIEDGKGCAPPAGCIGRARFEEIPMML
jgi:hypothetical protein